MPRGIYKRKPRSAECREHMRQAQLGHKHSPETREKVRQAMLGKQHALGRQCSPESREKMRQAALRRWRNPEYRDKMRDKWLQNRLQQTFPKKMTSIECLLRDEFKKRRLYFEMHKTMFGRFQPDFVFEEARLIIQADGDYWHTLPGNRRCDTAFNVAASAAGWTVWRFGEREIKMHAPACARAVGRFVRDHDVSPRRR